MAKNESDQIEVLVDQAVHGNRESLGRLFDVFRARLKRMIELRMDQRMKGRVDPSDVLQETYLDLARKIEEYGEKQGMSFFVWLRLLAGERLLKTHRQHLQTAKRDANREQHQKPAVPEASSVSLVGLLINESSTASQRAIRREAHDELKKVLDSMDVIDREILALRHFEELSNQEAAETLGLSKTATSNRYIRALKRLKLELDRFPEFSRAPTG